MMGTAASAGWHPDPAGRHDLRYWDGRQWTEHVSDGGAVSADPLPGPPAAQTLRQLHLDVTVSAGVRGKHRLILDEHAVYWDHHVVPYDQITALAYLTGITKIGAGQGIHTYELWLHTPQREHHVLFSGGRGLDNVFETVLTVLGRRVAPRLCAELHARIAAGETVEIGPVALSRIGIRRTGALVRDREVPWSAYAATNFDAGLARVWISDEKRGQALFRSMSMKIPNSVLLPLLLPACAESFGSGPAT